MRRRFLVLDGLRGIAALAVVFFHIPYPLSPGQYRPNGWIAVDFFFCLSGFVLANAHERQFRERRLSASRFAVMRVIRIAPMVLIGTLVAALTLPWAVAGEGHPRGADILPTFVLSFACLPWIRSGSVFWMNGVFWSLLAEMVANLLYGLIGPYLTDRRLAGIVAVASLVFVAGCLTARTMDFAFSHKWDLGSTLARTFTSFFIGVGLLRLHDRLPHRPSLPVWVPVAPLVIILAMHPAHWTMPINVALIFTAVPMIVLLGSLARPKAAWLLERLGEGSFPVYAIHAPLVVAIGGELAGLPILVRGLIYIGLPIALLAMAIAIARFYEEPARRMLRKRFLAR